MVIGSWVVIVLFLVIVSVVGGTFWQASSQIVSDFSQAAGRSPYSIGAEMYSGFAAEPQTEYRFLVLGTDEVEGSNRPTILTDIIQVVSYRPADKKIRLLSFPRDLYLPEYETKINGLYRKSLEEGLPATQLPTQAFQELTGMEFDSVVVVRMGDLASLIDIVGGIDVEVSTTFEDPLYPRDGIDVTVERDPAILYETIRFEAGWQRLDGTTAIKYARTRHSADPSEGSDQARIRRQQQVIDALAHKMTSEGVLANPTTLGKLYDWYSQRFSGQFPLPLLGNMAKAVYREGSVPELESIGIPATDLPRPPTPEVLLVHPALTKYNGQWAYDLVDPSGEQLHEYIRSNGF